MLIFSLLIIKKTISTYKQKLHVVHVKSCKCKLSDIGFSNNIQ